jgi:hypothetical protein
MTDVSAEVKAEAVTPEKAGPSEAPPAGAAAGKVEEGGVVKGEPMEEDGGGGGGPPPVKVVVQVGRRGRLPGLSLVEFSAVKFFKQR